MRSTLLIFVCLFVASAFAQTLYTQAQLNNNDAATFQYALTLENIEADFYTRGQLKWTAQDFINAGFTAADYTYFNLIRDDEVAHANFLAAQLTGLGITPVASCNGSSLSGASGYLYTALGLGDPYQSVSAYIAVAAALEPLGTNAYVTAATFISSRTYLQAAATIATVEGRHSQYIINLNANRTAPSGTSDPTFPSFDSGLNVSVVAGKVQALSATCAANLITAVTPLGGLPSNLLGAVSGAQFLQTLFSQSSPITATSQFASTTNLTQNDIAVLQYALYLEYFEAAFYAATVGTPGGSAGAYTAANFQAAGYAPEVFPYLQLIAAHEAAHVSTLMGALGSANTIAQCVYNFTAFTASTSPATIATFINTAAMIEPVGVSAYDGVANALTNRAYLQVAASIATVEARHSAILAVFALSVQASTANIPGPFPNVFDTTRGPVTVRSIVLSLGGSSPLLTETNACKPIFLPALVYNQQSVVGASPTVAATASIAPTGATANPNGPTGPTSVAPTAGPKSTNSAAFASVSAIVMMIVVAAFAL